MPDGHLAVLLGDASGHGLAAALVIAQVRAMLRALCESQSDPSRLLACVNARLAHDLVEGRFVTAFLACVSPAGQLRWASAGQGPILVRRAAEVPFEPL
jgi:sigma-B regulation protein RsbU (phosphoserine phosphatase)